MMSTLYDWKDLVLLALLGYLAEALKDANLTVEIGWPGDLPAARPLLTLEAGDGEYRERRVEIERWRPKTPGALAPTMSGDPSSPTFMGDGTDQTAVCVCDHGVASFPIYANLWVRGGREGKATRSRLLRAIQSRTFTRTVGRAPGLDLTLANGIKTRARVMMSEAPKSADEPEGVRRDEWRARMTFLARHPLETEQEFALVNEIDVRPDFNLAPDAKYSVASAIENGL